MLERPGRFAFKIQDHEIRLSPAAPGLNGSLREFEFAGFESRLILASRSNPEYDGAD